jgi:hypothetical protein
MRVCRGRGRAVAGAATRYRSSLSPRKKELFSQHPGAATSEVRAAAPGDAAAAEERAFVNAAGCSKMGSTLKTHFTLDIPAILAIFSNLQLHNGLHNRFENGACTPRINNRRSGLFDYDTHSRSQPLASTAGKSASHRAVQRRASHQHLFSRHAARELLWPLETINSATERSHGAMNQRSDHVVRRQSLGKRVKHHGQKSLPVPHPGHLKYAGQSEMLRFFEKTREK